MDLVREILDNRLSDREGRPIGRVDGIVLQLRGDAQPRVSDLAAGGLTAVNRMRPPLRTLMAALAKRWSVGRGRPYLIPWGRVVQIGIDVVVAVDEAETPAHAWERRARRVVGHIPGA